MELPGWLVGTYYSERPKMMTMKREYGRLA